MEQTVRKERIIAQRIVIYGGSGGIGSTTARLLRASGHDLHLVGRNKAKLAPLAAELDADFTVGDVCEETLFSRVTEEFAAPWDGLVYSVGTITFGSIRRLTRADFLQDFQVNALGAALAIQGGLSALKKSAGCPSVVLFSSVAVLPP